MDTNSKKIVINEYNYAHNNKPFIELKKLDDLDIGYYGLLFMHVNIKANPRNYKRYDQNNFVITGAFDLSGNIWSQQETFFLIGSNVDYPMSKIPSNEINNIRMKKFCGPLCTWLTPKGQLISESLFDFSNFPKNQRKILTNLSTVCPRGEGVKIGHNWST